MLLNLLVNARDAVSAGGSVQVRAVNTTVDEQYAVMRRGATEPAFSGDLVYAKEDGVFRCAGCDAELFDSSTKFESGTGWPSGP